MPSRLILHADDFGMSPTVSDGILRGFRHGLLTSTSLVANAPDAVRALSAWKSLAGEHAGGGLPSAAARERLDDLVRPFDLGVHLNLTQGRPLTGSYPTELLDSEGRFPGVLALFTRLRHGGKFHAAIRAELEQQVRLLYDSGLRLTHLNGHQYIEMLPGMTDIVLDLLARFQINAVRVAWEPGLGRSTVLCGRFWQWPLAAVKRAFAQRFRLRIDAAGIAHSDVFFGTSHAGRVNLPLLRRFLAIAKNDRIVEVGLHPGAAPEDDQCRNVLDGWHDPLARSRPSELQMLVSAELVEQLESQGWRLGRLGEHNQ